LKCAHGASNKWLEFGKEIDGTYQFSFQADIPDRGVFGEELRNILVPELDNRDSPASSEMAKSKGNPW